MDSENKFVVTATRPNVDIDPARIEEWVEANFDLSYYSELRVIDQETHEVVYDGGNDNA